MVSSSSDYDAEQRPAEGLCPVRRIEKTKKNLRLVIVAVGINVCFFRERLLNNTVNRKAGKMIALFFQSIIVGRDAVLLFLLLWSAVEEEEEAAKEDWEVEENK